MSASENAELNELLASASASSKGRGAQEDVQVSNPIEAYHNAKDENKLGNVVQWATQDDRRFVPIGKTRPHLPPGLYQISKDGNVGLYFEKLQGKTEGLIRFPDGNIDKVVSEIQRFWEREKLFKKFKLTHKRGILLYGVAGSGKSSAVQLIVQDVISRGGIGIQFVAPHWFLEGMRLLRTINPETPVVILMEDMEEILRSNPESAVLNILDGAESLDKCVFLATTNHPEELGARIVNRPSRFDKRFKIGVPNRETRRIYFEFLFRDLPETKLEHDLDKWETDTEGFSVAHLRELFTTVVIMGDTYEESIATLKSMNETVIKPLTESSRGSMGFAKSRSSSDDDDHDDEHGF